jgi:hypothetical protein
MREADMEELVLHPIWKQAIRDFLAAGFKEGDVITHAWLEEHFGMKELDEDKPMKPADFQERQFEWLRNMEAFRSELLQVHQIFLSSVHGEGYRIVPPREQTALAQEKFERDAGKAYRKAAVTLKNVRLCELTDDERKSNTDAIAKLAMLRGMHRGVLE